MPGLTTAIPAEFDVFELDFKFRQSQWGHEARAGEKVDMSANDQDVHKGSCFCGAVEITATGAPFAMGYCHCKPCREWSAAPVTAYTLWQPGTVSITAGSDKLTVYSRDDNLQRKCCSVCGGNVLGEIDGQFTDVFAAVLPTLEFKPEVHVNYGSSVLPIRDGLPKLKDFPAEMGGSGELLPE